MFVRIQNTREREIDISQELDIQFKKIGYILGTRWVASSYRTVNAVLKSYTSLVKHFEFKDSKRKHEHATFKGPIHNKLPLNY